MSADEFKQGRIVWSSGIMDADKLNKKYPLDNWDDGFAAFSNCEKRLADINNLQPFLQGRADARGGPEGYLMEAGLWRSGKNGQDFEELSLEREGADFFVQYWQLITNPLEPPNCFFREAGTFTRGNITIFSGSLPSFEVVIPEHRLRFYITRGASS